jgi:hypothetical protein
VTNPTTGGCAGGSPLWVLNANVGTVTGTTSQEVPPAGTTVTEPISFGIGGAGGALLLFEPGSSTPRILTVSVSDGCGSGHLTVNSAKFDMVGLS